MTEVEFDRLARFRVAIGVRTPQSPRRDSSRRAATTIMRMARHCRRLGFCCLWLLALAAHAQEEGTPPFITTPEEVVERMLALAGTGPEDFVIDLGSGDGRIVIAAAKRFGARGLGVDLDGRLVKLARESAEREGVAGRASFEVRDVLRTDVSGASVVTIYLLPGLLEKLKDKLYSELRPGARIVAHAFSFVSWKPDRVETVRVTKPHRGQGEESTIFIWIVPAEARGAWRAAAADAGGAWRLRIHQNFQDIEVEATAGGRQVAVREATLTGDRLEWSGSLGAIPVHYRGRIAAARIVGEMAIGAGVQRRLVPLVLERAR